MPSSLRALPRGRLSDAAYVAIREAIVAGDARARRGPAGRRARRRRSACPSPRCARRWPGWPTRAWWSPSRTPTRASRRWCGPGRGTPTWSCGPCTSWRSSSRCRGCGPADLAATARGQRALRRARSPPADVDAALAADDAFHGVFVDVAAATAWCTPRSPAPPRSCAGWSASASARRRAASRSRPHDAIAEACAPAATSPPRCGHQRQLGPARRADRRRFDCPSWHRPAARPTHPLGGPVKLDAFARYPLLFGPSPVHRLERLTAHLGGAARLGQARGRQLRPGLRRQQDAQARVPRRRRAGQGLRHARLDRRRAVQPHPPGRRRRRPRRAWGAC